MTPKQKLIKAFALALAIFLIASLALGAFTALDALLGTNLRFGTQSDLFNFAAVSDDVTILDIDISSAELSIEAGSFFGICSHNENVTYYEDGNRLVVTDSKDFSHSSDGIVIIRIPRDRVFEKVEISAGAGEIDIEGLTAEDIKMTLGAGDVYIKELNALGSAAVSCTVGELTVKKGSVNNLEADFGIGDVELQCGLTGKCEIDCGLGDISIVLPGTEKDYRIEIDKSLASAKINGKSVKDDTTYGDGPNIIDIDGAVGAVSVETE